MIVNGISDSFFLMLFGSAAMFHAYVSKLLLPEAKISDALADVVSCFVCTYS